MDKRNLPQYIRRKLKRVPRKLRDMYLAYFEDCERELKRLDEVFKSAGEKIGTSED